MARKPKHRRQTRNLHSTTYNYSLATAVPARPARMSYRPLVLQTPRSDQRFHNPTWSVSAPAALNTNATRLKVPDSFGAQIRSKIPTAVQFTEPKAVALCVRRKQRREVLFAKNKHGRHGAKHTRRNYWSNVSC